MAGNLAVEISQIANRSPPLQPTQTTVTEAPPHQLHDSSENPVGASSPKSPSTRPQSMLRRNPPPVKETNLRGRRPLTADCHKSPPQNSSVWIYCGPGWVESELSQVQCGSLESTGWPSSQSRTMFGAAAISQS